MDYFRQHKQMTGFLLLPVLLLVWLSFSCQNCFADTLTDSMQQVHVAMDCCPSGMHADDGHQLDTSGCDNNNLLNQPAITDEVTQQLSDFQLVLLPLDEIAFESTYPILLQPTALSRVSEPFSDRSFSSYRILLI